MVAGDDAPLAGMRVLDLGRFVAGSYVAMVLGALGADVIKVEMPPDGDSYRGQSSAMVGGESALFLGLNNGKRSVALDFRRAEANAAMDALVRGADVLVQNARPGALIRYGLDAASALARNPRLVYASISGYGEVGPDANRGGFDLVLQAEAGLMSITGTEDGGPVAIGAPLLDIGAALACVSSVLAALLRRERSGIGGEVSASLLEFSLAGLTTLSSVYLASGKLPARSGGHSPMFAPYGTFSARDGYIVLAGAGTEPLWKALCAVLGCTELVDDPRFRDNAARLLHRDELAAALEARLVTRDVDDWLARLETAGVPSGRVRTLDELLGSAQVEALGAMTEVDHPTTGRYRTPALPLRLDGSALTPRSGAPRLGADTVAVLREVGLGDAEIEALIEGGVASAPTP